MKQLLLFLFAAFQGFFQSAWGNPGDSTTSEKLVALFSKQDCLSCENSALFYQADRLSRLLTPEERVAMTRHQLPLIRYHAFLFTLATDEEAAFELFSNMKQDTSDLCFFCCMIDMIPLNEKMFRQFYGYLSLRYKGGRFGTVGGRPYYFKKQRRKRKTWIEKRDRLLMIATNVIPADRIAAIQDEYGIKFRRWK